MMKPSNKQRVAFLSWLSLCLLLGRGYYLFNGALIKPGWVLTVANVLQVKKGAKPIKPSKLQVVLGRHNHHDHHHHHHLCPPTTHTSGWFKQWLLRTKACNTQNQLQINILTIKKNENMTGVSGGSVQIIILKMRLEEHTHTELTVFQNVRLIGLEALCEL